MKLNLYGDYHIHSEFSSDGSATVDEIVRFALKRGLKEIAITDHGPSATSVGIKQKNLPLITALIEKANKEHPITVLAGLEANVIGTNGEIDVTEEMRTHLDILVCGIHPRVRMRTWKDFFSFKLPNILSMILRIWTKRRIRKNTEIMRAVIEKNDVDIWAHPNLYFRLNVVEVAKTCAERGTIIELNRRISFRPIDWERMKAVGAKFILNSDFHSSERGHDLGRLSQAQQDFLTKIDWEPSDFVNLTGEFRRGEANLLKTIKQREYDKQDELTDDKEEPIQKPDKRKLKQKKKLERAIRRKRV